MDMIWDVRIPPNSIAAMKKSLNGLMTGGMKEQMAQHFPNSWTL